LREPAAARPARSGFVEATALFAVGVAILIGLGIWQLERRVWKHQLIASLNADLAAPPRDLPPRTSWSELKPQGLEFHRVSFPAEFLPGQEALVYSAGSALRPDVKGAGYWVFAPARLAGGSLVIVDRGFVPPERKETASRTQGAPHGVVNIVGVMRWPEPSGSFTPAADVKANVWYARDIKTIAAAKRWSDYAPFYVDQETPVPAGGWPKPGKLVVNLPDNHLQYALTWFGGALLLCALYIRWLVRRRRRA
jgi:surfeit locus 1 family protein